ncbi:hypothetical protein [Belliella aquatica]|uniref:DUF2971 domain-containing protein n=1 Tax=Belliella aquatica TaxID=1323734 RepID=A0ABQ1N1J4_9BACT|nr:hypothetical protein [Belliella aquatica]MCH7407434.1 hypothetical protein [Belliella aquatica]GGC49211.1 DUF2971 domain-containing protein [Belliella aquatica]
MKVEKTGSLHGNQVIWRYMSLEKFIDLVLHRSLFFANAIKMEDKFEMEIPLMSIDKRKKYYLATGLPIHKITSTLEKEISIARKFKENTYVSCWSLNTAESYALWKIYLGGSPNGVAIKSTVSKLIQCIESVDGVPELNEDFSMIDFIEKSPLYDIDFFKIGEVKYKNYIDAESLTKTNLAITKKEFYEYEKEIRVFATSNNQKRNPSTEEYKQGLSSGFSIPVEIEKLIDKIVLSPYSQLWFKDNFKILIERLNKSLLDKIVDSEIGINS